MRAVSACPTPSCSSRETRPRSASCNRSTPLEISLAWLPFEYDALGRATVVDFAGVPIRVATAEDLVVFKTVAWRDRDRGDIERLLQLHGREMDLDRVRRLVREFSDALDEPERPRELEALVRRALG